MPSRPRWSRRRRPGHAECFRGRPDPLGRSTAFRRAASSAVCVRSRSSPCPAFPPSNPSLLRSIPQVRRRRSPRIVVPDEDLAAGHAARGSPEAPCALRHARQSPCRTRPLCSDSDPVTACCLDGFLVRVAYRSCLDLQRQEGRPWTKSRRFRRFFGARPFLARCLTRSTWSKEGVWYYFRQKIENREDFVQFGGKAGGSAERPADEEQPGSSSGRGQNPSVAVEGLRRGRSQDAGEGGTAALRLSCFPRGRYRASAIDRWRSEAAGCRY